MITPEKEIENYLNNLETGKKAFMMGSLDEEIKYIRHNRFRFEEVLKRLDELNKRKSLQMLDIGTSPLTFIINKRFKGLIVETLDYSHKFKKLCLRHKIGFRKINLENRDFRLDKDKYNIVLFLEVIEHLEKNHQYVIKQITQALKKKGVCFIQTPNRDSLRSRILSTLSSDLWERLSDTAKKSSEFEHKKEFTKLELENLIRKIKKVKIVESSYKLYFDQPFSALVYRKFPLLFLPFFLFSYQIVRVFPFLRRGIQVEFVKV